MPQRYTTFADFWLLYAREHSHPLNRALHFFGTSLFIASGPAAVLVGDARLLLVGVACGYGFAWIGHFFVQRNRPASFRFPVYSLIADFVMYGKILRGQMEGDVRAGIAAEQAAP